MGLNTIIIKTGRSVFSKASLANTLHSVSILCLTWFLLASVSLCLYSLRLQKEPEQELPSVHTMVYADPSQLTRGALLVALFQSTGSDGLSCSCVFNPPLNRLWERTCLPAEGLLLLTDPGLPSVCFMFLRFFLGCSLHSDRLT